MTLPNLLILLISFKTQHNHSILCNSFLNPQGKCTLLLPLNGGSTLCFSPTNFLLLLDHCNFCTWLCSLEKISSFKAGSTVNIYEPSTVSNTVLKINLKISIILPNLSIIISQIK